METQKNRQEIIKSLRIFAMDESDIQFLHKSNLKTNQKQSSILNFVSLLFVE